VHALRYTFQNCEEILVGTLMALMSLATLFNVAGRYFFSSPIPWAEEFSRYAFIWLVFFGAVVCTKQGRHIAVDVLVPLLPKRLRCVCHLVVDLATLALMSVIIYYGSILTASATSATSTLGVPRSVVYSAAPLSAALIFAYALRDLHRDLRAALQGRLP
jgi:TRAP-type C4-dicarboxylate transport system permease small subunit